MLRSSGKGATAYRLFRQIFAKKAVWQIESVIKKQISFESCIISYEVKDKIVVLGRYEGDYCILMDKKGCL